MQRCYGLHNIMYLSVQSVSVFFFFHKVQDASLFDFVSLFVYVFLYFRPFPRAPFLASFHYPFSSISLVYPPPPTHTHLFYLLFSLSVSLNPPPPLLSLSLPLSLPLCLSIYDFIFYYLVICTHISPSFSFFNLFPSPSNFLSHFSLLYSIFPSPSTSHPPGISK